MRVMYFGGFNSMDNTFRSLMHAVFRTKNYYLQLVYSLYEKTVAIFLAYWYYLLILLPIFLTVYS